MTICKYIHTKYIFIYKNNIQICFKEFCVSVACASYFVEIQANYIRRECFIKLENWKLNEEIKNDLNIFCTFSHNHYPQFTIAGFLSISRHTVLSLLSASTFYIILLIQFREK